MDITKIKSETWFKIVRRDGTLAYVNNYGGSEHRISDEEAAKRKCREFNSKFRANHHNYLRGPYAVVTFCLIESEPVVVE